MGRRNRIAQTAVEKAVFIRLSSLGDIILATPAVRSFKASFPRSQITFLTKEDFRPLLEGHPDISNVVGVNKSRSRRELGSFIRLCKSLGPHDVVVDLHQNLRSCLARWIIPSTIRRGYRKQTVLRRLWAMGWMRRRMESETRHTVDQYLEALLPLGVEPVHKRPKIFLSAEEVDRAADFLRSRGVAAPQKIAVLVPGAKWPNKRWVAEGFAAVGELLKGEMGLEPVLVGDVEDKVYAQQVRGLMTGKVIDVVGETGLRQLAAILRLAEVTVGNDSGPGHLAAAVGTPVVSIFGPTVEAFGFTPQGRRVRVVSRPLDCRPCTLHGGRQCLKGRRACLDDIKPSEVFKAVQAVLAN